MDAFTIITGLAGLAGFAIQILDLFPRLGKARLVAAMLFVGVFVGGLLRAIEPASIRLDVELTGFSVLTGFFAVVIVGFAVWAACIHDPDRREQLLEMVAGSGVGFLVFLAFGYMFTHDVGSDSRALTMQELTLLADHAAQASNTDRAIMHLRALEPRLRDEKARKRVQDRVRELEHQALR